ncbi:ubiquinone anaerobic biosynthesis accessory factor UbiT [Aestuariispira ectoiniformans]|uniref:ubiquinone anaerobic biosynthesis accessory factor UbiT n=1 Tax=Aestuariispira ectoiniformans TaxID=2775080 RepID=UPI00223B683C|nr:SCP2 sterol-binding domain-containing protein [Aestuariispira ectoiniformans]
MFKHGDIPPPLSPALLAGLVLRPVPPRLMQPVFSEVMRRVSRRYRSVFDRVAGDGPKQFLIDPVDLPFVFLLSVGNDEPGLTLLRDGADVQAVAAIRGPIAALLALLEGKIDGDALFFSRVLTIEGDTGAVLALRNSVDGAEIDLRRDVMEELGPFAGPARHVVSHMERVWTRLEQDMQLLSSALLAPVHKRLDQQEVKLRRLTEESTQTRKVNRKRGAVA